ncbi:hypothetical protein IWX49DRAFT_578342 [Phyllosticta citricarpa]
MGSLVLGSSVVRSVFASVGGGAVVTRGQCMLVLRSCRTQGMGYSPFPSFTLPAHTLSLFVSFPSFTRSCFVTPRPPFSLSLSAYHSFTTFFHSAPFSFCISLPLPVPRSLSVCSS